MPDWLYDFSRWFHEGFKKDAGIDVQTVTKQLVASLVLGCVVAGIYRLTHTKQGSRAMDIMATLVLLTVLFAMVTVVVGRNTARAFSLVGVLGVVRFRTVMEDTRDTAFVVFAVGVGMALGAGYLEVPLVGIPIAGAAAFLFKPRGADGFHPSRDFALLVRVGIGNAPDLLLGDVFQAHLEQHRLTGAATARQGAAIDYTYRVRLRPRTSGVALVAALNAVEGVQNVELRQV
jgi:hypothetical protein